MYTFLQAIGTTDWWTNKKESGARTVTRNVDLSIMPIYVKAGAIIPFDPVRQYTSQEVSEPTTIKIFSGVNGEFTLYNDDGISQEYLTGKGSWTSMVWNEKVKQLTIKPGAPKNAINEIVSKVFVVQLIPGDQRKTVTYNGKPVMVAF